MLKITELRMREVVNVLDGRRLGPISDLEIDLESMRVKGIVVAVAGQSRVLGLFGKDDDLYIPWEQVIKIGVDVILVEIELPTVRQY